MTKDKRVFWYFGRKAAEISSLRSSAKVTSASRRGHR
jgi:hypothetical protein